MSFFKNYPLVKYAGRLQVNLTRRAFIPRAYKSDSRFYIEYTVQDGETPISIADKLYDNAEDVWIILEMNDIVNVHAEWPMPQATLDAYVLEKYDNPYAIHHYITLSTGAVTSPEVHPLHDLMPVTNYEHETIENDKRRTIKLLVPDYIAQVKSSHREALLKGL